MNFITVYKKSLKHIELNNLLLRRFFFFWKFLTLDDGSIFIIVMHEIASSKNNLVSLEVHEDALLIEFIIKSRQPLYHVNLHPGVIRNKIRPVLG